MIYLYYAFLFFLSKLSVVSLMIGIYHNDILFTLTGTLFLFASFLTYFIIKEVRKNPFNKR